MSKLSVLTVLCGVAGSVTAETLYNGIVLPEVWPPETSITANAGPQPVPYLRAENIPTTIPIDVGRQLFVDDFLIESTNLKRVYHHPRKYEGNPVLNPETPWEINTPGNSIALPKAGTWRSTSAPCQTAVCRVRQSSECVKWGIGWAPTERRFMKRVRLRRIDRGPGRSSALRQTGVLQYVFGKRGAWTKMLSSG